MNTLLRQHAEQQFAEELAALKKNETQKIPENWAMSPQSIVTYFSYLCYHIISSYV